MEIRIDTGPQQNGFLRGIFGSASLWRLRRYKAYSYNTANHVKTLSSAESLRVPQST